MTVMPSSSGQVAAQAGVDSRLAQAGIGEHLLHQHGAADDLTDRGKLQRDGRQGHVPQAVAQDDGGQLLPPGPGEEHVVRLQHVHHLLPGVEGDGGHPGDAEGQGREHGVVEPLQESNAVRRRADGHRQTDGEPPQPDGEHHQQQKGQPEGGGAGDQQAPAPDEPVRPPAPQGPGQSRPGPGPAHRTAPRRRAAAPGSSPAAPR